MRPPGCAREGVSSREVQILPRLAYKPEAESNCVTKRWGGEQQEARESSVIKGTRFGHADWRAR